MFFPISLAQRAIALGSSISPNLLGSARSSRDDSLERTRATREMSLRYFLPPQRVHSGEPECTRCGGKKYRKLISRVARVRSKESSLEDLADPSKLGDMDDPKAMARWAKEMGKTMADETGEELPEDFDEMMEEGPGEDEE